MSLTANGGQAQNFIGCLWILEVFKEFYFIFEDEFLFFRQPSVYQVFKGFVDGAESLPVWMLVDGGLDDAELHHFHGGGNGVEGDNQGPFLFRQLHDGTAGAVDAGGQNADGIDFRMGG